MKPLLTFFLLTFAVTWGLWFGAAALAGSHAGLSELLLLPGTIVPALVALWLIRRREGMHGVRALGSRLIAWRVKTRWYVFAVSYMAGIKLFAALGHRLVFGAWPHFGEVRPVVMLAAIVFSTGVQAGEETGWRGFALPHLAERIGLRTASVGLGVIWAAWHLPLFFLPGSDVAGQSFPVYLLGVTALSVAMAWLYAHTQGSVLLVMLMHAAINNTTAIVPGAVASGNSVWALTTSPVGWISIGLLWICAGYFLACMPKLERA